VAYVVDAEVADAMRGPEAHKRNDAHCPGPAPAEQGGWQQPAGLTAIKLRSTQKKATFGKILGSIFFIHLR
jgi:hypothetical protein